MKASAFEFARPATVQDVTVILAESGGDARVLAGGQSLVPMLNLRLARPSVIVDISRLDDLKRVEVSETEIVIGALVTHATLEFSQETGPTFDILRKVAAGIAYRGVRNRGTIGGSMAHADPAADWLSCLTSLDARLSIAGPSGTRQVPVSEFILSSFTTSLQTSELLTHIHLPRLSANAQWGYYKHNRKVGEFAEAIGSFVRDDARGIRRVVAGALSSPPVLLFAGEGGWPRATDIATLRAEVQRAVPAVEGAHIHFHAAAVMRALQSGMAS